MSSVLILVWGLIVAALSLHSAWSVRDLDVSTAAFALVLLVAAVPVLVAAVRHQWRRSGYGPKLLAAMAACAVVLAWTASPAFAADGTTIDFGPFIGQILGVVFTALLAVLTWAAHRLAGVLRDKLHVSIDDTKRQLIDTAIANGIAAAQHALEGRLQGKTQVDVRNAVVAEAVRYVLPKIPDTLAYFGITPVGLQERVAARVTQLLGGDPLIVPAAK